jgi:hypothetical protein
VSDEKRRVEIEKEEVLADIRRLEEVSYQRRNCSSKAIPMRG